MPPKQTSLAKLMSLVTERSVLGLSLLVMLIISARVMWSPHQKGNVYPVFAHSGRAWLEGQSPYNDPQFLFRYTPLSAAVMSPMAMLPEPLGSVLWRWINYAALLAATVFFHRRVIQPWCPHLNLAWLGLCLLPLAVSNLNNGQSNPLLLAMILTALAAVHVQRWNLAALCLAGAAFLKIYPIALALLLILLFPRALLGRWLLAMAAGVLLPFLMQHPSYVVEQYQTFLHYSFQDTRMTHSLLEGNRDVWLLIRRFELPLSLTAYRVVQMGTALLLAGLTLALRRHRAEPRAIMLVGSLAIGWMLLFGPATESATYHLVCVALAADLLASTLSRRTSWSGLVMASYGLHLLSGMAGWFPIAHVVHSWGILPLATLLWMTALLGEAVGLLGSVVSREEKRQRLGAQCSPHLNIVLPSVKD